MLATFLRGHPAVAQVWYPREGLRQKPAHMTSGGAVVTFRLSRSASCDAFLTSLRVVKLASSLGGVKSLINRCATMSHGSLSADERNAMGLNERVLRLSAGLEEPTDLLADRSEALAAAMTQGDGHVPSEKR